MRRTFVAGVAVLMSLVFPHAAQATAVPFLTGKITASGLATWSFGNPFPSCAIAAQEDGTFSSTPASTPVHWSYHLGLCLGPTSPEALVERGRFTITTRLGMLLGTVTGLWPPGDLYTETLTVDSTTGSGLRGVTGTIHITGSRFITIDPNGMSRTWTAAATWSATLARSPKPTA